MESSDAREVEHTLIDSRVKTMKIIDSRARGTRLMHLEEGNLAISATLQHDDTRAVQYASWSSRRTCFSILIEHDDTSNFKRDSTDRTCR